MGKILTHRSCIPGGAISVIGDDDDGQAQHPHDRVHHGAGVAIISVTGVCFLLASTLNRNSKY